MRADARRNRERILAEAEEAVAESGADASFEEIARRAGVGSATLHRHFPTRQSLLEAVFRERVEALCAHADTLARDLAPRPALTAWLHAVAAHAAANRGLAPHLMRGDGFGESCHRRIIGVGDELLAAVRESGEVRDDVTAVELLQLVGAIALAAEADGSVDTDRLLAIALDGLDPRR
ncbi:MAG: TetR/AcrR family transcriptional regulator [Streptomycetaceae bacterium]|nr:TetR/AcrR family transcriptional regulator [Streptomycetaceae bacterium]